MVSEEKVASAIENSMTATGPEERVMVLLPTYVNPLTCRADVVTLIGEGVDGGVGRGVGEGVGDGVAEKDGDAGGEGDGLVLGVDVGLGVPPGLDTGVGVALSEGDGVGGETVALGLGASASAPVTGPAAKSTRHTIPPAAMASTTGRTTGGMRLSRIDGGGYVFFAWTGVQAKPSAPPIVPSSRPMPKPP